MDDRNPLAQIPIGTDLNGLMSRVSQGFENPYYFALSEEEIMACYIFSLDMRPVSISAGIPCEVIIYDSTTSTRARRVSFQGQIIGRTVLTVDFVTQFSSSI
ncbi:hypothetical protein DFH28DRAFT_931821 [Melampsora americana]|nr:hypothetical protein DFH28DRAFT_931821 [Melampsora americana]